MSPSRTPRTSRTPSPSPSSPDSTDARSVARAIRRESLRATLALGGGYLAQACSSAELLAVLYCDVLRLGKPLALPAARLGDSEAALGGGRHNGQADEGSDRFFIGSCHYAMAVYSALASCGRLDPSALGLLGESGWNMELVASAASPGYETTTGSLGQTLSCACGCAHASRLLGRERRVFCLATDGELDEGQMWEAIQAAGARRLDNLVLAVDVNRQQAEGWTEDISPLEPLGRRLEDVGWAVARVDGHDVDALRAAFATEHAGRPLCVLCDTDPARGIPAMADVVPCHFVHMTDELRPRLQADLDALSRTPVATCSEGGEPLAPRA